MRNRRIFVNREKVFLCKFRNKPDPLFLDFPSQSGQAKKIESLPFYLHCSYKPPVKTSITSRSRTPLHRITGSVFPDLFYRISSATNAFIGLPAKPNFLQFFNIAGLC